MCIRDSHEASPNNIEVSIEERHANVQWSFEDNSFIAISDDGANSNLISSLSFHIESVVPNRFATIKGCKNSYISRGNQIGTGLAVVVPNDPTKPLIGIRVHERAIHNEALSLLSEYQMAEYKVIVDSRAKHHLIDHEGNTGRQMISPSPGVEIALEIRSALMTLKLRKPTLDELEKMVFHTLTSDEQWIPGDLSLIHI